jgi:hypothetical protein
MLLYQNLLNCLLALQQAQKHPTKLTKIMAIFQNGRKSPNFTFSQFVPNIFSQNIYYPKALRKCFSFHDKCFKIL